MRSLTKPRILTAILLMLVAFFLSGCVRYDVGIDFHNLHEGEIVQHVRLGKQLTNFSQVEAQNWLQSIQRRAKRLGGKTRTVSSQEIVVTIPFSSGRDLEVKFDRFFNPNHPLTRGRRNEVDDLVQLNSQLELEESNFIFWQRVQIESAIDLRALGVFTSGDTVVVDPGSLLDLEFSVSAPGIVNLEPKMAGIRPEMRQVGDRLIWQLQPGQVNVIEVAFWMPEPLSLGAVAIAVVILVGYFLKYREFPWSPSSPTPSPEQQ